MYLTSKVENIYIYQIQNVLVIIGNKINEMGKSLFQKQHSFWRIWGERHGKKCMINRKLYATKDRDYCKRVVMIFR